MMKLLMEQHVFMNLVMNINYKTYFQVGYLNKIWMIILRSCATFGTIKVENGVFM